MLKRLLLATVASLLAATTAAAQTVYVVRHAEKADQSSDPALSAAGEARAQALAAVMAEAHPSAIIVTPLQRTGQTAAPTAAFHSVTPEAVPLSGGVDGHVAALVARVRAQPADATVLVVGHSNTVPLIARALGYADAADMQECEYDRMTVLQLTPDGEAHGDVSRYGAPANCPPA